MDLEIRFVAFLAIIRSAAISSVTISMIAALISVVIFLTIFDWAYFNLAHVVFTCADGLRKAFIAGFSGKFAEMGKNGR